MLICLSFVDMRRPEGSRFLGACFVRIEDTGDPHANMRDAVDAAWRRGCNPGGEVRGSPFTRSEEHHVDDHWLNRLLTRAECDAFDREMTGKRKTR